MLLQGIVADRGRRFQRRFHIALLQERVRPVCMERPHARETIGLQFHPHLMALPCVCGRIRRREFAIVGLPDTMRQPAVEAVLRCLTDARNVRKTKALQLGIVGLGSH